MKRHSNTALKILFIMAFFIACQQEQIVINDPQGKTLDAMSPLANIVGQTTLKDGSADNIIDNSSCITIVLPVTVIVNGTELIITSPDDFVLIERIFDASADDKDVLEIVYPIQVVFPDYEIEDINSDSDLAEATEDCLENGLDDDIECVDFKYPVSLSVYNSVNQVAEVVEITSDAAFNDFFDSIDEQTFFTFNYPVTLILSDSSEVVVFSNEEMEDLIDEVADSCDEDDDFDYNDDDLDTSELAGILAVKGWVVSYIFDIQDQTSAFENVVFSFKEDELAEAYLRNTVVEGNWELYGDNGSLELELEFTEEYPLGLLEQEDWRIDSYDSTIIELSYYKEDGSQVFLTLEATALPEYPDPSVVDYLIEGEWVVALFQNDGADQTPAYAAYKINFTADEKLTYYDDTELFEGSWEETIEWGEGHYVTLDFGSSRAVFELLNQEWDVVSSSESSIKLVSRDTDPETTDNLVLEKL